MTELDSEKQKVLLKAAIKAYREIEPHAIINRAAMYQALRQAIMEERGQCANLALTYTYSPVRDSMEQELSNQAESIANAIKNRELFKQELKL